MRVACSGSFTDAITNTLEIAIGGVYSARLDLKPVTSHVNRARCTPRGASHLHHCRRGGTKRDLPACVPLCMNLPVDHTPPVAIDTAQAGESFFAMKDKQFHQEVPVFESGQRKSKVRMVWVFGHLGMYDDKGQLVPDPARRGWVPKRSSRMLHT